MSDKLLLRKRVIIETVNDKLKDIAQLEYSRHRCFDNFIVNMLSTKPAKMQKQEGVSFPHLLK